MNSDGPEQLSFLPVALNVRGKPCLVVGGGAVGTRKVLNLLRAGAAVTVVSPGVTTELADEIKADRVQWVRELFRDELLSNELLVIAATDDPSLNASIIEQASGRGALVCDASSSDRSQLIFGALLTEGGATVAVFTDGRDPSLARQTRDRIAALLAQAPGESG